MRTFTVGFGEPRYDERPYARAVAERFATEHTEVVLEPDVEATLPRLAEAFDEPHGDEAALPLFLICEVGAARRDRRADRRRRRRVVRRATSATLAHRLAGAAAARSGAGDGCAQALRRALARAALDRDPRGTPAGDGRGAGGRALRDG